MQLGIITSLTRSLIVDSTKSTFHNQLAQQLLILQCRESVDLDSHIQNDFEGWFIDTLKPFFESRCNAVATVDDTNILIRDFAVAKAYYQSKHNQSILSSIGDVETSKITVIAYLVEAIEKSLKHVLNEPNFTVKQTRVNDRRINKLEHYNFPGDETFVAHAWYQEGTVATVNQQPPVQDPIVVQNPQIKNEKGWLDRNFKKIALAGMVLNLFRK